MDANASILNLRIGLQKLCATRFIDSVVPLVKIIDELGEENMDLNGI